MSRSRPRNSAPAKPILAVTHAGREFRFTHDDPDDHIFSILKRTGAFYESEMLQALAPLLRPHDLVLDVGANIGTHTVFFAGACGCRVIAFEPNPKAVESLRSNVGLNRVEDKVRIETLAVGAVRRRGALVPPSAHNLGTGAIALDADGDTEIVPLDEVAIDGKVALIKIDIEGNDVDVLRGASTLLARDHPVLIIEAKTVPGYFEIAKLLDPLGYVAAGSFNYSPTHLFLRPLPEENNVRALRQLGHRLAQQYIESLSRQSSVDQRLGRIGAQVAEIVDEDSADRKSRAAQWNRLQRAVDSLGKSLPALAASLPTLAASLQARKAMDAELATMLRQAAEDGSAGRQLDTEIRAHLKILETGVDRLAAKAAEDLAALEQLQARQAQADERLDDTRSQIAGVQSALADKLQSASDAAVDGLTNLENQVADRLSRQAETSSESAQQLHAAIGTLHDRQTRMNDRLGDAQSHIDAVQAILLGKLQATSDTIAVRLADLGQEVSQDIAQQGAASGEAANQLRAAIDGVHERQAQADTRLAELRLHIDAAQSAFVGQVRSAADTTATSLVDLERRIARVDGRLGDARSQLGVVRTALLDKLQAASDTTEACLADLAREVSQGLARQAEASSRTAEQVRAVVETLHERQLETDERLADVRARLEVVSTALLERVQSASERTATGFAELEQQLSRHLARQAAASSEAADRLDAAVGSLSDRQGRTDERLAETQAYVGTVHSALREQLQSASDATDAGQARLEQVLRHVSRQAVTQGEAAARLEKLLQALERRSDTAIETTLLGVSSLESDLKQVRREIVDAVERRLDTHVKTVVADHLKELRVEIARSIGRQFGELRIDLDVLLGKAGMDLGDALALLGIEENSAPFPVLPQLKQPDNAGGETIAVATEEVSAALAVKQLDSSAPKKDVLAAAEAEKRAWYVRRRSAHSPSTPSPVTRLDDTPREVPAAAVEVPHKDEKPPSPVRRDSSPRPAARPAPALRPEGTIAQFDFNQGWKDRGWSKKGTELRGRSLVVAVEDKANLGFVTSMVDCSRGGLLEIEVRSSAEGPAAVGRILQIRSEADEAIGHDFPLDDGLTRIRAFAPFRTKRIKLNVLKPESPLGTAFRVPALAVKRIGVEDHQAVVTAEIGQPVFASMASIPSRRDMLQDCVNSLLVQCDKVRVFLNEYPDVPAFLDHPRVEVRRSQDWDDRGDAGKFFWIDRDEGARGYRLIVDDDLVFPPDFAATMARKVAALDNKAVYAAHGVLLRQPINRYYDTSSRATTFHFGRRLETDRGVHIGATNAMCFHTDAIRMRWADFKYCNSADIWLSAYAQDKKLPILTPARPRNWIRENRHANPGETIYNHSLKRTRSRFDSSLVQDAAVRHFSPFTLHVHGRIKCGLTLYLTSIDNFSAVMRSWYSWRPLDVEWVILLAYDKGDAGMETAARSLDVPHEVHLVETGGEHTLRMTSLWEKLGVEAVLCIGDTVRFSTAPRQNGDMGTETVQGAASPEPLLVGPTSSHEGLMIQPLAGARSGLMQALVVSRSGDRLSWLVDLIGDTVVSSARSPLDVASILGNDDKSASSLRLAHAIVPSAQHLNDAFERVLVLNLDRRQDRWQAVRQQFARVGINCERISATDGSSPQVTSEYDAYRALPLATVSNDVPPVRYEIELYLKYSSQRARLAYIEGKSGRKAITSAGAWGYLRSYERVLEQGLEEQTQSMIVFDDDVVLHNDFRSIFATAMQQLPDDWLILQLGTLQYNWSEPWAQWRNKHLYQTNGSAVGSHAVGMRFGIYPFLLDHVRRMDMPYDVGPLSAATRAFPDKCFVVYPNLAIQRLADSDIGTSAFQKSRSLAEIAKTYRWNLGDYGLESEPRAPEAAQPLARMRAK